jgi:hypothetical protein
MTKSQQPEPVQLEQHGLYETQAAIAFQGIKGATESTPALIHLLLLNGAELRIPVTAEVVQALRAVLSQEKPEVPDWSDLRMYPP